MLTSRASLLAVVVLGLAAAGCVDDQPCDSHATNETIVNRPKGDAEVDACITKHECVPLCADVFKIDPGIITDCAIFDIDANNNVTIRVRIADPARCTSDDGDDVYVDWGDDWGDWYGDDGSCDDGSCDGGDDGSTDDGGDDGSTDSGDDGGDDSGGDDGDDSRVLAPHQTPASHIKGYTLAPKR
jgi:hypothetical protein